MNFGKTQLKLLSFVQKDFKLKQEKKIDTSKNSFAYYALWSRCIGFEKLKLFFIGKKKFLSFLEVYFKDLISICFGYDFEFFNSNRTNNRKLMLISSALRSDFNSDGSYKDRYFQIDSNDFKEIIFFVNYLNNELPNKIGKNIVLFRLKKTSFVNGFVYLIKYFFKNLLRVNSLKELFLGLSSQSIRAENLFFKINSLEKIINLKKIIFPYEGQPFQQFMIKKSKKINKDLILIGYDHSAPHSLPFNLYYRDGSPDLLYVNGQSQIDHLVSFQNWPKDKIKLIPSLRYQNISQSDFSNKIFLPYQIFDKNIVLNELEIFLKNSNSNSLNIINVKTHPVAVNKVSQENLKTKIHQLFEKYSSKFDKTNSSQKISFFIGQTTGVIVALEKELRVIHICFEPIFDCYSSEMWPNLKTTKISNNSLEYTLIKKNSFIEFGGDKNLFKNFFINN